MFDKKLYWKRRRQGLHGVPPAIGGKEHLYDLRVIFRDKRKKSLDELKKGKNERKQSKAI